MSGQPIALFVLPILALVVPLSLGLALWIVARLRRVSDQPMSEDESGAIVVPVRQLKRFFGFFGKSANSINPRLELAEDGLRFKVFKPVFWRFADMTRVEQIKSPFVTRLEIRHSAEGHLWIDLADKARARDFLRALPPTLPFTPRSIALRDGPR